ncbi:HIT finger domain-containing protein [Cordyceps militaris CM01]|uniref:HIT finger domain-containing protein n=1 Tax=Cordyceps militaris (strain CM01) TaxID=983644 RepID=G3JLF6_CORMM|nr:HIT finger domain-containing protein [Cordyceps militaris CM01]EGX90530.1 HIT finger domain-containing protein [Cordyceps militaris CM01]
MNDFGVIELAGAKTTSAPGWAYVPDTRLAAQQSTTTTMNRKRARNAPGGGLSLSDLTARQENKMRKELEALDRDGGRDPTIPLPGKSGRTAAAAGGTRSLLAPPHRSPPPSHPGDADPLLVSRVPALPSEAVMRRLLAAPPLSYGEARGNWGGGGGGYPVRVFCAVCGYWGRVRCLKCGTRVCALECLEAHREECVTRYGI